MVKPPTCGHTFDGETCIEQGSHYCAPRAQRVVRFFAECLVHTKGVWARKPFVLSQWQREEIIEPLFGTVVWSDEWQCYRRQYTDAYIEIARKNGKSELAAGIALYLLCADDEESAEIYGCAVDIPQARKVFDVALRMEQLSKVLSNRLEPKESAKRIIDPKTASYYEVIPADAFGNLGHNPHGVVLDEAITQPNGELWKALVTAEGTRVQMLSLRVTTAGSDPASWAAKEHEEAERILQDPTRAPHRFVYLRNTPKDANPFDEKNWHFANPALGEFKSLEAMRRQAIEAQNDPVKENGFRQFQLNQWVQQVTRWLKLDIWDASAGQINLDRLVGMPCFAGLDLASTTDLAAWVLLFPQPDGSWQVIFRFWMPQAQLKFLAQHTGGSAFEWVKQGLLTATEGDWIDFDRIHEQIEADKQTYRILRVGYDPKEATATAQFMQKLNLNVEPIGQGYGLSSPLKELMRLTKAGLLNHGGNPVARWNADSAEVRQDDQERLKLVKPARSASGKRIDGIAALANAIATSQTYEDLTPAVPQIVDLSEHLGDE